MEPKTNPRLLLAAMLLLSVPFSQCLRPPSVEDDDVSSSSEDSSSEEIFVFPSMQMGASDSSLASRADLEVEVNYRGQPKPSLKKRVRVRPKEGGQGGGKKKER